MNVSVFIARLISLVYLAAGVGMLINPSYYQKMMKKLVGDASFIYFGGFMALIGGYLLVTYHNVWEKSWVTIITVIGWLALIKGVMLLVFPGMVTTAAKIWTNPKWWPLGNVLVLVLGLLLGYYGFLAQ